MPSSKQQQKAKSAKQQQKVKSGGMSPTKTSDKEELVQARAVKRAERVEARRVHAEQHKETGNVHFRAGNYRKAIEEYKVAIKIHGPSAAYLSNMAAACLKLKEYDQAEFWAQCALDIDPRFIKARYRRGLARKGNLELARAAVDFKTILTQDPNSTGAKDALRETNTLMHKRNDEDDSADSDDELPKLDGIKLELESVSDSSDWIHDGNGIPCRFYNHDGCLRGTNCKFSHAPDHKSVRDRLGRNVCMYFLMGICKFGLSACVYSHDKTYLPSGRWWDDEDKCDLLRHISGSLSPDENSAFMPYTFAFLDDRIAWVSAHGAEMEEAYGNSRDLAKLGFQLAVENAKDFLIYKTLTGGSSKSWRVFNRGGRGRRRLEQYDEFDSEAQERMDNHGFTEDEVMELLCQGVKPWDEDASDVLDALYSL